MKINITELNRLYTELNSLMNKAKHDKADERRMAYLPIIREWVH